MSDLRAAQSSDLAEIARLEVEIFAANAWSQAAVAGEIVAADRGARHLLVSTADNAVVGYAVLMCSDDVAEVLRIAVQADYRREGRASAMVEALLDIAGSQNCRRMLLEVAADNTSALDFYAAWGFAEIDRRRSYYAGGVDAVVLGKPL